MLKPIFSGDFYFARHGETEYNSKGLVSGDKDVPLSPLGVSQTLSNAELVAKLGVSSAFCSPLTRAVDTARNLLSKTSVTPIVINHLKERHWGRLQGISKTELDKYNFAENGVEDWELFSRRTITAIKEIKAEQPAIIIAHSGTFRVLLSYLKINLERKQVKNAHPYKFFKFRGSWKVVEI
jgi:broad specificity phosphatase PhoE